MGEWLKGHKPRRGLARAGRFQCGTVVPNASLTIVSESTRGELWSESREFSGGTFTGAGTAAVVSTVGSR